MTNKTVASRRQYLAGTGGFALALPFLPSLATRAYGQDPSPPGVKRFFAMTTEHGAIHGDNMCPAESALTQQTDLYPGHTIRHGALIPTVRGTTASICPVLSGPASVLTRNLVSKLNVLRGFDIHFDISHHNGGHLGNFAAAVNQNGIAPRPTVDQVIGWSPSFYRNLGGIRQRAVVAGQNHHVSWGFSNPAQHTGSIQPNPAISSTRELFQKLIAGAGAATPSIAQRKPIVDRVIENYRQLRNTNRRLSVADRMRLDDHVGRLAELERRIDTVVSSNGACLANQNPPAEAAGFLGGKDPRNIDGASYFPLLNSVIAMAFACDTTRVVVYPVLAVMTPYSGNWHQDFAHQFPSPGPQAALTAGGKNTFEHIFLDLAAKLDAIESAPGRTLLDETLMQWTQEAGPLTHSAYGMTVVTAGSAAGYFKTGLYVDYRRRVDAAKRVESNIPEYMGLAYRQWLGNVLRSMGLPTAEFESEGQAGYGDPKIDGTRFGKLLTPQVTAMAGSRLPVVANG